MCASPAQSPKEKLQKKTVFFSTQEKRKEKTMEKTVREFVAVVQAMPWIIHLRKGFYAVNACTVSATYEEALTAERAALKARAESDVPF